MPVLEVLCDSRRTQNYINDYPAFLNCYGYFINNDFYNDWYDFNAEFLCTYYNLGDDRPQYAEELAEIRKAKKRLKEYLENRVHMTLSDFETYVLPVIKATSSYDGPEYYHSIDMKKAEYFLRYIEPAWCDFKGIESTGYLPANELERAAELLSDTEFDDI